MTEKFSSCSPHVLLSAITAIFDHNVGPSDVLLVLPSQRAFANEACITETNDEVIGSFNYA
jgi:hypothetical protein